MQVKEASSVLADCAATGDGHVERIVSTAHSNGRPVKKLQLISHHH